jgi:serine/threonine-protein phosphatase 2B catalytic subunit
MADTTGSQHGGEDNQQLDNAIRALHKKKPVPEIDFTLHTMEDGREVSTLERVCKGEFMFPGI